MQFWTTVTFRAEDEEERLSLRRLLQALSLLDRPLVAEITATTDPADDGAVVADSRQARRLVEGLQRLTIDDAQQERLRRGWIRALAFAQHYMHHENGWDPAEVVERHNLRMVQRA